MSASPQDQTRSRAIAAAQGLEAFDVLLTNGTVVDVATAELREADVGIVGSLIASVHARGTRSDAGQSYDVSGKFLSPGFIDTHVHFESSHMTPGNYSDVVVPQGTTTIFCDPHELANVMGIKGVRYAIEASRGLPLRVICTAPSSVPSAPGLEMSGADFEGKEMREMLSWPEIAGVSEIMDMKGVLGQSRRMTQILSEGIASGKIIEGHARGLTGQSLQAYMAAGVTADHEITSAEDAIEKLRAGLTVEIRGSHDYLLPEIVDAINKLPQIPQTLTICTDDVAPDHLVEKGGLNDVLRRLVQYGMNPAQAIRCATLNASYRIRRPDLGLIAAGRAAEIVVLADIRAMAAEKVFVAGKLAAEAGRIISRAKDSPLPSYTSKLRPLSCDDCRVEIPGARSLSNGRAKLRVIRGVRFTSWGELEVEVKEGFAVVPDGYSVMLVQHRHGRHAAHSQRALLADWGELHGAVATTYSHDAHNLVVIGRSPEDMRIAANALVDCGGGMAVAKDGKLIAKVEMPIAGLLSAKEPQALAQDFARLRRAADQVVDWKPPYRVFKAIEGICLACNPGPHLTDLGLTDGTEGKIVNMVKDEKDS